MLEKLRQKFIIHGITKRWMVNNMLVVFVVVLICMTIFSIVISNNYYTTVRTGLESKAKTATDFFSNYITKTYAEYYDSAYRYTEAFEDSSKIELQFVDTAGRIEISSSSITAGRSPGTSDITDAIESGKISTWVGKSPITGERVIAVAAPLKYSNGQTIGVIRYVTSLKTVNREIVRNVLFALGFGIAMLAVVLYTNMFFIRSVVQPVNEITQMARRIADGSYGIQINRRYEDEIGDMVAAINEMSLKISSAERTQTEFISSVSHELRTPLTAITGWAETIIYNENLDKETRRGIGIMLREARRLTKMVEELLEFTRMQDGRFTLNVERIDVGAELEDSIFTYRELFRQDELELVYEPYEGDLPLIDGDPERLRQVFLNILDNAAKYGHDGKRIIVAIGSDEEYVWIKIRDFGPGIPDDELEHVKKKFYKGSSKKRGSGIGLAVCDEIVKYHNGLLELENAEGGGLRVTVKLPHPIDD